MLVFLLVACSLDGEAESVGPAPEDSSSATSIDTGGSCFHPDTPVATPLGERPIGSLEVGDAVVTWSEAGGFRIREVGEVHRAPARERLLVLTASGAELEVTPHHPFFDPVDGGWREAGQLVAGDVVYRLGEGLDEDVVVDVSPLVGGGEVVHLTVDGPEATFFADGVLVHNKSPIDTELVWIYWQGGATVALEGPDLVDGWTGLHVFDAEHRELYCTWSWPWVSATPASACTACDFAFDITWGTPEPHSGDACGVLDFGHLTGTELGLGYKAGPTNAWYQAYGPEYGGTGDIWYSVVSESGEVSWHPVYMGYGVYPYERAHVPYNFAWFQYYGYELVYD